MLDKLKEEARRMEELQSKQSGKPKHLKNEKRPKKRWFTSKKDKSIEDIDESDSEGWDSELEDTDDTKQEVGYEEEPEELGDDDSEDSVIDITAIDDGKPVNKTKALFNMYAYYLQHYLTKGKNLKRMNLDDESMQIEYDRIFTKNYVKCVWTLKYTGDFLPENFFGMLKEHLDRTIEGSRTSIILTPVGNTYEIDFSDKKTRDLVDHWSRMKASADRREARQSEADVIKDTQDFLKRRNVRRMFNSFTKYKAYTGKQFKFAKFYVSIEGITSDNDSMALYQSTIESFCADNDVSVRKVTKLHDYLRSMNVTTKRPNNNRFKKTLDTIILSDLDIAELDSYSQGTVGNRIGVYAGTDVETSQGVYINFTESTKAQNILITAITGGGKSFFIKCLLLFHALCGHRLAIMDYEGKEYIKLVKWLRGKSISMSLSSSIFVNTLKVPSVKGMTLAQAKEVFLDSFNATERIFKILANIDGEYKDDDIQSLFQDLMDQLYTQAKHGIVDRNNPITYQYTKDLDYFMLYNILTEFKEHTQFKRKYGKLLDIVHMRLAPYWSETGSQKYLFENELELQDLYDSKILHFDFGMQNTTDDSRPPKETLLKISMMTYVFSKYHAYNLKHGFYTVNLMEEFQRSGNSPLLLRTVNHWITGGRKGNIVNYIVTNAIGVLTDNSNPDARAIKDNITTFMIGKCRKHARDQLIEAFDLQEFADTLHEVSKNPAYSNCFLVIFDTGHTRDKVVTCMQIAPKFLEDDYFKTRREEKYEEWEI